MLKSRFDTTYIAPSHVVVRDMQTDAKTNLISHKGLAIDELKVSDLHCFLSLNSSSM